ncbi:hypothetical protein A2U01_0045734, partial [Trifolium medium]|nr:hypothetical protein [Trifolium medium]
MKEGYMCEKDRNEGEIDYE